MHFKIRPRFCMIVIGLMVCVFSISLAMSCRDLNCAKAQLQAVTDQRSNLAEEIQVLEQHLDYAQTDDYVIRVARDELGLIMPDEVRYITES